MADTGFDVEAAKKAGYSEDEILQHLTQTRKFDVDGAVKAGYSKADIIGHLSSAPSTAPATPAMQQPQEEPGMVSKYISSVADNFKKGYQAEKAMVGAAAEDVKGALTNPSTYLGPVVGGGIDAIKELYHAAKNGHFSAEPDFLDRIGGALGINTQGIKEASEKGVTPEGVGGIVGHMAVPAATIAAGASTKAAADVAGNVADAVPSPRGAMAARMAEKPPGEQFTRQEVLDAARSKGVNLDLAQATDSPVLRGVKKGVEHTLGGGTVFEGNQTKNLNSLQTWANDIASKYSPEQMSSEGAGGLIQDELHKQRQAATDRTNTSLARDAEAQLERFPAESAPREVVGSKIQQALKQNLEVRKGVATDAFKELDRSIGKNKIDVTDTVQEAAKQIVDSNSEYYEKHPDLVPRQAWSILKNLAADDSPKNLQANAGVPKTMSWSELHTLRSDLMDFYRNNPDVVKGRSESWIQTMVGKIDNAMTQASGGLTGENLAKFRSANGIWENIKSTYDNPQSPYFHAVRSGAGSQVFNSVSSLAPEYVRTLKENIDPQSFTAFQRAQLERLIDPNASGNADFAGLNTRVSKIGNDKLTAIFGDHAAAIKRFAERSSDIAGYNAFEERGPMKSAIEARNPLDVVPILSGSGPMLARQVRATIGALEGPFQRQYVENLLRGKEGKILDLPGLEGRLNGVSQDHLRAMLGEDGAREMRLLGKVASKVTYDSNISGSAKGAVRTAEIMNLFFHPPTAAAEIGSTYGVSKGMTNPKAVDFLTKKPKR